MALRQIPTLLLVVALWGATSNNPTFAQGPPPPPDRQMNRGEPIGQQQGEAPVIGDPNPYPKAQSRPTSEDAAPVVREYHTTTVVRQPVYINTGPSLEQFRALSRKVNDTNDAVVSDRTTLGVTIKAVNRHEQTLKAIYETDVTQNDRLTTVEGNIGTLTESQKRNKERFETIETTNMWQWAAFAAFAAAITVVSVVMFILNRRRAANQAVTVTP